MDEEGSKTGGPAATVVKGGFRPAVTVVMTATPGGSPSDPEVVV